MKVKIIQDNGLETAINPDSIVVGGITLSELLKRLVKLEKDVNAKFGQLEAKEKRVKELMGKL